jgi:hypothetical protein
MEAADYSQIYRHCKRMRDKGVEGHDWAKCEGVENGRPKETQRKPRGDRSQSHSPRKGKTIVPPAFVQQPCPYAVDLSQQHWHPQADFSENQGQYSAMVSSTSSELSEEPQADFSNYQGQYSAMVSSTSSGLYEEAQFQPFFDEMAFTSPSMYL